MEIDFSVGRLFYWDIAEKNDIGIKITTVEELITQLDYISDLHVISKSWKSTKIIVNGIEIGVTKEYGKK